MKKILFFSLLVFASFNLAQAQADCALLGTATEAGIVLKMNKENLIQSQKIFPASIQINYY